MEPKAATLPASSIPLHFDALVPAETARLGPFQRLFKMYYAPREVFEDIDRKPSWVLPVLSVVAVAILISLISTSRLNRDEIARQAHDRAVATGGKTESQLTDQDRQRIESQVALAIRVRRTTPLLLASATPLGLLLVAWLYHGLLTLAGERSTFAKVFSVTAFSYAAVFSFAETLLKLSALFLQNDIVAAVVSFSPVALLSSTAPALLEAGLRKVNAYTIGYLVLVSIGLAAVSKPATVKKMALLVFGAWAIWFSLWISLRALFLAAFNQ